METFSTEQSAGSRERRLGMAAEEEVTGRVFGGERWAPALPAPRAARDPKRKARALKSKSSDCRRPNVFHQKSLENIREGVGGESTAGAGVLKTLAKRWCRRGMQYLERPNVASGRMQRRASLGASTRRRDAGKESKERREAVV